MDKYANEEPTETARRLGKKEAILEFIKMSNFGSSGYVLTKDDMERLIKWAK